MRNKIILFFNDLDAAVLKIIFKNLHRVGFFLFLFGALIRSKPVNPACCFADDFPDLLTLAALAEQIKRHLVIGVNQQVVSADICR